MNEFFIRENRVNEKCLIQAIQAIRKQALRSMTALRSLVNDFCRILHSIARRAVRHYSPRNPPPNFHFLKRG